MRINNTQTPLICNTNMIVPHSDHPPVLSMSPVYPSVFLSLSCGESEPNVAEFCHEGTRDVAERSVGCEVRNEVVGQEVDGN